MSHERFQRIKEIFHDALKCDPDVRHAFLEEACQEDPTLRPEVEALLAADTGSDEFMDAIMPDEPDIEPLAGGLAGTRIGQYLLVRVISSGGMGTVYEAVQEHPKRTVAVKIMKAGLASRSALRRFEYESQILASLRHPGIAQVIEAGTFEPGIADGGEEPPGLPYFVMEYIPDARDLIEYAKEHALATKERLRLFEQVLEAVHHGHQKGIIHRDLKPANILIDPQGRVKIIDFGVARATDADLAVTTQHTDLGQLIGTVQYMSPEQCRGDSRDLDIRSDVYALGMVLYELLCGRLPYDVRHIALLEATRRICEDPPEKPSTTDQHLRGDVETILLKALEKERDRRYPSADALCRDIECFLKGEPIAARPPSALYQLKFFARRNRALVSGVTAAFFMLVFGVIVSLTLFFQARAAGEVSRKINDFLTRMLASMDPVQFYWFKEWGMEMPPIVRGQKREDLAAGMILQALPEVESYFNDEPRIEAMVRETLGMTLSGLGRYQVAEQELRRVLEIRARFLGVEDPDTLRAQAQLASTLRWEGKYLEAEALTAEALPAMRRVFGSGHLYTQSCAVIRAETLTYLGGFEESNALYEEAYRIFEQKLGSGHRRTLGILPGWARSHLMQGVGKSEEAGPMFRRVYEDCKNLDDDDFVRLLSEIGMGHMHVIWGNVQEAEELFRIALEKSRRILGENHFITLMLKLELPRTLLGDEVMAEKERLLRECLEGYRTNLKEEGNFYTYLAWDLLIAFLSHQGRFDDVEALLRERFESRKLDLTEIHPYTRSALAQLARYLWGKGDSEESLEYYRQWAGWITDDFQRVDLQAMDAVNLLAARFKDAGRTDEGEALLLKFLEAGRMQAEGPDASPSACMACARLLIDAALMEIRDGKAALELARRAVELSGGEDTRALETLALVYHATNADHEAVETMKAAMAAIQSGTPERKWAMETQLIRYLCSAGRAGEAEELIHEIIEKDTGRDGMFMPERLIPILLVLIEEERFSMAEPLARRCLELCTRFECNERWERGDAQGMLGNVLAGLGRFEEAEPLLLAGYRELSRKPYAFEEAARTLEWIVSLYEKWGKPEEAKAWRVRAK